MAEDVNMRWLTPFMTMSYVAEVEDPTGSARMEEPCPQLQAGEVLTNVLGPQDKAADTALGLHSMARVPASTAAASGYSDSTSVLTQATRGFAAGDGSLEAGSRCQTWPAFADLSS